MELRDTVLRLLEGGAREFVIDLCDVDYCDSVAVGHFVGIHATVKRHDGSLRLNVREGTSPARVLRLMMLDRLIKMRECDLGQHPFQEPGSTGSPTGENTGDDERLKPIKWSQ